MEAHTVLELLLFYAIPRADTNLLAHRLIDRFGCISGVFDATTEELMSVEGIGESSAILIKMMPQLFNLYTTDKFSSKIDYSDIDSIGRYLVDYFLPKSEECVLLIFYSGDRPVYTKELSVNIPDMTDVDMRMIARTALTGNATGFIIAHNHPHGAAKASQADITTTAMMMNTFGGIGLTMREHIIVGGNDYFCLLKNMTDGIFI